MCTFWGSIVVLCRLAQTDKSDNLTNTSILRFESIVRPIIIAITFIFIVIMITTLSTCFVAFRLHMVNIIADRIQRVLFPDRKCMLTLLNTVGCVWTTCPFRLSMMYSRSSLEMRRCSAGVLVVRSIHSIIVIVDIIPTHQASTHGTGYQRSWNCCDRRTKKLFVIWKHFCFILSTNTRIRIDSVMRPRSSSSGRNTSASVTVTVTHHQVHDIGYIFFHNLRKPKQ